MRVKHSDRFWDDLDEICAFIALDSVYQAEKFERDILKELEYLGVSPYGFRPSLYVDDPNVRDYISKKRYTIPYRIDEENNKVTTLGIFKYKLWQP